MSEASDAAPEASDVTSNTSDATPEASDIASNASDAVPEASDVASNASGRAPEASVYFAFPAFSLTKPSLESFQKTSRASSWGMGVILRIDWMS